MLTIVALTARAKAQELTAAYETARAAIHAEYKNEFLDATRAEEAADWRKWIAPFQRERQARLRECKQNYYRAVLAEPSVDCFPMGTELFDTED